MKTRICIFILLLFGSRMSFSQGSWHPAGADLSYPRTLLDSNSIDEIRGTLSDPLIIGLYHSVWNTAASPIPAGNSTDGDRFSRALIAREAAFTVLMNRKWENGNIVPMLQAERDSMSAKAIRLLNSINTKVGYQSGWVFYQEWQHRSKELIFYLTAYDLLKGAGISGTIARDSLVSFTGNLYYRAMATYTIFFIQFKFFNFQFDNHSIMTASALGLAAVVLNEHEDSDINRQPQNWINAGLWNLDNTLWVENGSYPRVSEPDKLAGYAEGPGYFDYAFQNAFPFIRSMCNFLPDDSVEVTFNALPRKIRNPWYDPRYDRIYDWMNRIMMPDGSEPAIHDSPIGFGTRITALSGKPQYNLPNENYSYDSPFIRTQYISTNVSQGVRSDSLFQVLPDAGSLVFRSSWEKDAIYLHMIGKHGIALSGAKSHHQGDASSFSLMAYNQLLAVDPGYPGAPESNFVNRAQNHNCILVNAGGPKPPTGEFVSIASNTAYIEDCFQLPGLEYGEVRTSYWGDSIIRCNLFVRHRFFIMNDFCISPSGNRRYTFQFHGNGLAGGSASSAEGEFIPDFENSQGIYKRDTVSLLVQLLTDTGNPAYSFETDSLAAGYSSYRQYSKMQLQTDSASKASFQTLMFPYTSDPPVTKVINGISGASASVTTFTAWNDFILTQSSETTKEVSASMSGLPQAIECSGEINYLSFHPGDKVSTALLRGKGRITYGKQILLMTNRPMLAAWHESGPGIVEGVCSDSGQVSIYNEKPLRIASGPVESVAYDSSLKLNTLICTAKGKFRLEPSSGLPERKVQESLAISAFPNPSADGIFRIGMTSGVKTSAVIEIKDQNGKTLSRQAAMLNEGRNAVNINLSDRPSGEYFLNVICGKSRQTLILIRR